MRARFILAATLILLTAAVLRLYALHDYPPGPHYDEAVYLIVSRNIAFGGARFFPMVEAYQGREVLYMYLNAPFLQYIHDDIFTLHMVSAFCNLLTIASSIALGRLMFRGKHRGWLIGLTVGALITLSFPQIWLARQAFRAVTLPMMQALALAFLWRGLTVKRRDWLWLIAAGLLAGGAVYTYNSSRLFPLWLGIAGLALLIFDRARWRLRVRQGAIFFGVLILTAAPMALYAVQRPDVFFGRLTEVTQADQSVTLLESIWLHVKMFFIDGDPYLRYNIPHRPYFTLPEGLLLVAGLIVAAIRLVRRGNPLERTAYLLALLSPLMVIPSVISVGGLPPSHMRSLGMIPLIFVAVAVGAEWLYSTFKRSFTASFVRKPSPNTRKGANTSLLSPLLEFGEGAGVGFLLVLLLLGGVLVGQTYFAWATRADLYYETDNDLSDAAQWLVDQPPGDLVYIAARDKGHPTAMIEPLPPVTWLGTDLLFLPPSGQTGLYLFPRSAPPPEAWRTWLEPGVLTDLPLAPDGRTAFEAFRIDGSSADLSTFVPAPAQNAYLTLVGANAPPIPSGETGALQLAWQVKSPPPYGDFTPLVQLEDALGTVLARVEPYMTLTNEWRTGETLIHRIELTVPPTTPPGDYALRVAWVGRASDHYEPYLAAGIWAEVGSLTVTRAALLPDPAALNTGAPLDLQVGGLRALGFDFADHPYRPGETLPLTLYWQADGEGQQAGSVTMALGDLVLRTWSPFDGYEWLAGEILAERLRFDLPRDLPAGTYPFTLNGLEIAQVRIEGIARVFDPPPMDTTVNLQFGDQLELIGYTIESLEDEYILTFNWRCTSIIVSELKFFIHLVDSSGIILEQIDNLPHNGSYPASLWAINEVVTEVHHMPRIADGVVLRVGVYNAQTLERLALHEDANVDFFEIRLD